MVPLFRRFAKDEKGSVIILVALGLTVFMGFTAIVTDVGLLYVKQNKLAHALDAAALAGVQELPADPAKAVTVARDYAEMNGIDRANVNVSVSADNRTINVTSDAVVNLIFAGFFGKENSAVTASAEAKVAAVRGVGGAVPFSIEDQTLHYGQEYVLKSGANGTTLDGSRWSGWFGALDYTGGGGGASEYEDSIKYGYSGTVSLGDIIELETGNMSGKTKTGVEYRIHQCQTQHTPQCTLTNFRADCPRIVYVPVVRPNQYQGSALKNVRVVGFAAFYLLRVEGSGNANNVVGSFIQTTISADSDEAQASYGLNGVKLTK